jgi:hypothetical protein
MTMLREQNQPGTREIDQGGSEVSLRMEHEERLRRARGQGRSGSRTYSGLMEPAEADVQFLRPKLGA